MTSSRAARQRGSIDELPSGSLRVRVYAGIDPVTKGRYDLTETITPGPHAAKEAEAARVRLVNQVNEQRHPKTRATVNQLITRHLELLDVSPRTLKDYEDMLERHVRPFIGKEQAGRIDAEILESLYSEMRRCRRHCRPGRRDLIQHRTLRPHSCDEHQAASCSPPRPETCGACRRACKSHTCEPLGGGTILKLHWILSGAFAAGVRWGWISRNPADHAQRPTQRPSEPNPPSPADAARLIAAAATREIEWASLLWIAMTTGARRGELCALQWRDLSTERRVVSIEHAIKKDGNGKWYLGDTKTHQKRRVLLEEADVLVLRALRERAEERADAINGSLSPKAYVFSPDPDGGTFRTPDSVTQRFDRLATYLQIDTTFQQLRQYNATELLLAGVDLRTVAGRLGHGSGGVTTLRFYAGWVSEANQRAAASLSGRMPQPPAELVATTESLRRTDQEIASSSLGDFQTEGAVAIPYLRIATDLYSAMTCGVLQPGDYLPPEKALADRYRVSPSTAHRAVRELADRGLVVVARGRRAEVTPEALEATRVTNGVTSETDDRQ